MGFRHWTVRAPMHNVSLARRPVPIVNWDQNCRHSYGVSGPALGTVEVMKGTRGDQKSPATLAAGVLLSLLAPPPWYCWHGVSSRQDRLEHCRVFRSTPGPHTPPPPPVNSVFRHGHCPQQAKLPHQKPLLSRDAHLSAFPLFVHSAPSPTSR